MTEINNISLNTQILLATVVYFTRSCDIYFFPLKFSILTMAKDSKSLFRIPKIKDDVMKIVCVILNILISGNNVLLTPFIHRFWYHCRWCFGWYWYHGHPLRCSPTCLRWFRPRLHLVLGLGLLHCCPKASLLSTLECYGLFRLF